MADFTKFRTSVGGFNRSDVADYIEALCVEQKKALKALEDEKESLTSQLEEAQISLTSKEQEARELRQKLEETETALAASESALEEALELADTQTAQPKAEPQAEQADYCAKELEAYRRAEAAERLAMERASRLRSRLSGLVDTMSGRYEQTGQEIQALSEDIRTNLQRMQEVLSDLDVIFEESTDAFETLDAPEPEEQEDAE